VVCAPTANLLPPHQTLSLLLLRIEWGAAPVSLLGPHVHFGLLVSSVHSELSLHTCSHERFGLHFFK
jgi:hypothetical protein